MISLIQNIIATLDHIILLLLKNDFVCNRIHFSKMLWQCCQLPKTNVHWSGCRSDDTHTEPADNSYQLQNWIFLSSPSPDEYSSTETDNVASTLTPLYATIYACLNDPLGEVLLRRGSFHRKSAPCLSIGISACDCRNFRISGILRNVDNELCPKNLCPYVFVFPFCETSFRYEFVVPADCGGSLHLSVDRVIRICW